MVFKREEPGQWKAVALALLVHALFLGVMIFGVSWQNKEPAAVEVELWSALPAVEAKHVPPPLPPKPEPQPEPKPKAVKHEPPPEAKPNKADIELKAKEAKRKEEEQKKRKEEELKQEKEKHKLEQEKRKEEQEKREQEKKSQQEKAEKLHQQQAQAEAAAARQAQAGAQQSAAQKMVGDYKARIQAKIKHNIILPPDLAGNPQAEFDVILMPTGEVLNLKLTRSSGSSAYDSAVERAINKSQPLPLPPDPGMFSQFRELHLKFRPIED